MAHSDAHVNPVDAYAHEVVEGRIPAGKYHRLACLRHLKDRAREATPGFPYRFEAPRASRIVKFAQQLKHYKGEWAGQPIVLTPYQQFRLGCIFGWVHAETGLRRFRKAYNEIPRKSGKSLEAAIVAVYVTFFDGEPGAEGFCSATKRDQALIVFRDAKKLIQSSGLKDRLTVQVANVHSDKSSSKLEPLSADHNSMDGLNPHLVIIDELHAHKDRGVIDVLETAMGARRQPLMFEITTAGDDLVSPCGDEHDYACKILDGVIQDETFFGFVAHADVAHRATYQFPFSLEQLVSLCSCDISDAIRKQDARTTPLAIQTETIGRETSARAVTTPGSKKPTPNMPPGNEKTSAGGRSEIKNATESIKQGGDETTSKNTNSPNENHIWSANTASQSRPITSSTRISAGNVEFASSGLNYSPSITATIRQKYGVYFASNVIPDSVSSEILKMAFSEHSHTCAVRKHQVEGSTLIVDVPEDDWLAESTWKKANPHYGVSVNPDDMRALASKAKHMPAAAAEFKQKKLNLWVNSDQPWLSLDGWQKGQSLLGAWDASDLRHQPCYVGIDLANKLDLLAMVFVFPPTATRTAWRLLRWIWTPEDTLIERSRRDRAPYDIWRDQGYLLTTPGTRIDHQVVRDVLRTQRKAVDIEQIGFDPWHADTLIDQLVKEDGFDVDQVLAVPQTYAGMGSAAKRFEADVLAGLVDAQDDPVMRWCVSNAVVQRDGKDNIYPVKKKSRGRIDPVMATLIGLALYLRQPVAVEPSYTMVLL